MGKRVKLLAGSVLAFLIAAAFRWLTLTEFLNDHFDHVALAQQLRLGSVPLRDFVDEGMPLMYVVSAAAWSLIKAPFVSEAVIVALGFAIAAALSFRAASLLSQSIPAAAIATVAQVAIYPRTYSYPKLFVQAVAITVAWWALKRLTVRRIAALSAATALGYYFRHDHAFYLGASMIALLVVAQWQLGLPNVVRSVAIYTGFCAAFVLPHLVYVQWAVGIPTYVAIARQYVNSEAASAPYQLPLPYVDTRAGLWIRRETALVNVRWVPDVDERTRGALEQRYGMEPVEHEGTTWRYRISDTTRSNMSAIRGDSHVEDTHGFDKLEQPGTWHEAFSSLRLGTGWRARENSLALIFWLSWLLPAASLALLVAQRGERSTVEAAAVVMLGVLALCTDVAFLRAPLEVRLPDLAVSHSILGAWVAATLWRWPVPGPLRFVRRAAVVIATGTVLIAITVFGQTGSRLATTRVFEGPTAVTQRWREVSANLRDDKPGPVPSNPSVVLLPFVEYVRACTAPQDRLLFTWYSPELYIVANRGFAGDQRRIYRRLSDWEQARTIARLRQEHVPFVLIPLPRKPWLQETNPDIWRYIESRYVPMATLPDGDPQGFQILRESAWTGTSTYSQTGWPCVR